MASLSDQKGLIKIMNAQTAFSKAFVLQQKGIKCKLTRINGAWYVTASF